MIDADQYEGHTPTKKWGDIVYAHGYSPIFLDDDVYATDIDRQLMAAAPELLEEVKQLREEKRFVELEHGIGLDNREAQVTIRLNQHYEKQHEKLLAEVERLQQLIVDAAYQLHWNVGTIASSSHLSSKEWDEDIYAPAQAWRKQVQEILDDSEEGCPWKESEEE